MTTINTLFSGGQGATIPTGIIGEKITWASTPANQSMTTSTADWTNASITLTAGLWLVQANISAQSETGATSGNTQLLSMLITDTANTVIQNQYKSIFAKTVAAVANTVQTVSSFSFVANISTSTIYKIRANCSSSLGAANSYVLNSSSQYSEFFAIRIA